MRLTVADENWSAPGSPEVPKLFIVRSILGQSFKTWQPTISLNDLFFVLVNQLLTTKNIYISTGNRFVTVHPVQ